MVPCGGPVVPWVCGVPVPVGVWCTRAVGVYPYLPGYTMYGTGHGAVHGAATMSTDYSFFDEKAAMAAFQTKVLKLTNFSTFL